MHALKDLFTSDVGLLSLGSIVFMLGMGGSTCATSCTTCTRTRRPRHARTGAEAPAEAGRRLGHQTSQCGRSSSTVPSASITRPLSPFRRRPPRSLSRPLPSARTAAPTINVSSVR